jgi:hypothetical protein
MKPVFSMKLNLIKVLFFLLLILPSTFGFSPNFSTTTEHYFSEKIDLGIEGNYPLDTNYMNITIIGKDTNFVYFSQDLNLSEKDYFPFVFSTLSEDDLFYVIYSFISSDNKIINSKSFDLFLFRLPFSLNYFFCTDIIVLNRKIIFLNLIIFI